MFKRKLLALTRAFVVNNEIYMVFLLNSQAQNVSGKMNNLSKHHARGPIQLHRLEAGPDGVIKKTEAGLLCR